MIGAHLGYWEQEYLNQFEFYLCNWCNWCNCNWLFVWSAGGSWARKITYQYSTPTATTRCPNKSIAGVILVVVWNCCNSCQTCQNLLRLLQELSKQIGSPLQQCSTCLSLHSFSLDSLSTFSRLMQGEDYWMSLCLDPWSLCWLLNLMTVWWWWEFFWKGTSSSPPLDPLFLSWAISTTFSQGEFSYFNQTVELSEKPRTFKIMTTCCYIVLSEMESKTQWIDFGICTSVTIKGDCYASRHSPLNWWELDKRSCENA